MLHFLSNSQHNRKFCLWNTQTMLTLFTVNLIWTFRVYCTTYYTMFFICVYFSKLLPGQQQFTATIYSLYTQIINFAFYCMSIHSWRIKLISPNSVYKLRNYYLLPVAFPDVTVLIPIHYYHPPGFTAQYAPKFMFSCKMCVTPSRLVPNLQKHCTVLLLYTEMS